MGTIGYGFETQEHRETDGAGESGGDGGEGERDHGAFSLDGKGGRTRPLREREEPRRGGAQRRKTDRYVAAETCVRLSLADRRRAWGMVGVPGCSLGGKHIKTLS